MGSASTQIVPIPAPPAAAVTFPLMAPAVSSAAVTVVFGGPPAVTETAVAVDSDVWPLYHWGA